MATPSRRKVLLGSAAGLALSRLPALGQAKPADTEWRAYAADLASTRYAPLDQIGADNFSKLEVAWRFSTEKLGPRAGIYL